MLKKITAQERQPKSEDEVVLPPIPAKRYFTIGEVSELCGVKPHVLRYWEQEFAQLRQVKRRGNRRYYQHHEVLLVRRIRELLYAKGYTIHGARNVLAEHAVENDVAKNPTLEWDEKNTSNANKQAVLADSAWLENVKKELKSILVLLKNKK